MIKILLFLTVFTAGHGWQPLTDKAPQEFSSVAECMVAANNFLEKSKAGLGKDVPAIGAQCVVGNEAF